MVQAVLLFQTAHGTYDITAYCAETLRIISNMNRVEHHMKS